MKKEIDTYDLTRLGRTIKLVEKFEAMPDDTWALCKAILCCEPERSDPINAIINAIWDIQYVAHVMDALNAGREYGISTYIPD